VETALAGRGAVAERGRAAVPLEDDGLDGVPGGREVVDAGTRLRRVFRVAAGALFAVAHPALRNLRPPALATHRENHRDPRPRAPGRRAVEAERRVSASARAGHVAAVALAVQSPALDAAGGAARVAVAEHRAVLAHGPVLGGQDDQAAVAFARPAGDADRGIA